jgi:Family of unknown function (DUF5996)
MTTETGWPQLDWARCRETLVMLHGYAQVVGRIRLALTPVLPQWANSPLRMTARGLTTTPMWAGDRSLQVDLDLVDHAAIFTSSTGNRRSVSLQRARGAAAFRDEAMAALDALGVAAAIASKSLAPPESVTGDGGDAQAAYYTACAESFFQVLARVSSVFEEYRAGFWGKQTEVSFWWGTFDMSVTRFSGRPAEPPAGKGLVERVAQDAEQAMCGFWPGDERAEPGFFAYTYPRPAGIERAHVAPSTARWSDDAGEFLLSYADVAASADPRAALMGFLRTTYEAGAELGGWDTKALEFTPPS